MRHFKTIATIAAILLAHTAFAMQCPEPTQEAYQKTMQAADWVAKVEVLSKEKINLALGFSPTDGMTQRLKLRVAVHSVLRADAALPLTMFDAPIEITTEDSPARLAVGEQYYVFAQKSNAGNATFAKWQVAHDCSGYFIDSVLRTSEEPRGLRFIWNWLNELHPKPPILPLDQTPGLRLVLDFEGLDGQIELDGWHLIPDLALPATPKQNASLNKEAVRIYEGMGAIYLGPLTANPAGKGFVFNYLSDPYIKKTMLRAGYYRLVNTMPQATKHLITPDSLRIQIKRSELVQTTIRFNALTGNAAVAAMCPAKPESRAYFESNHLSANAHAHYLANHRLFLHARYISQGGTVYDENKKTTIDLPNNLFRLEVLSWYYSGQKPSAGDVRQQGLIKLHDLYFQSSGAPFAGQRLIGQKIVLNLNAPEYSQAIPLGALPSGQDSKTKLGEEFLIAVEPSHHIAYPLRSRPSQLAVPRPDLVEKPHSNQKAAALDVESEGINAASITTQAEIAAQYAKGQALLYSHWCTGWVRVSGGALQWADAPPEPMNAYIAQRSKRITSAPELTQSVGNFHAVYTSLSTGALELDLAGWR